MGVCSTLLKTAVGSVLAFWTAALSACPPGCAPAFWMAAAGACSPKEAEQASSAPPQPPYPDITCPYGFSRDAERTRRLLALLKSDPEGKALLQRTPKEPIICYGPVEQPELDLERRLRLAADASDPAAAAAIAHLLQHIADGFPPSVEKQPSECDRWLEQVRGFETRAHNLENRVRKRLGAKPPALETLEWAMGQYEARCHAEERSGMR